MPLRALDPESSVSTKFHHPGGVSGSYHPLRVLVNNGRQAPPQGAPLTLAPSPLAYAAVRSTVNRPDIC